MRFLTPFLIFFNLFKRTLFITFILVFITFVMITLIPIVINSYNYTLEKSLATKQPHIVVKFVDDKTAYSKKQQQKLESTIKTFIGTNKIDTINSFVESTTMVKFKSYGYNLSEYAGYTTIIGLSTYSYPIVYNFDDFTPVMLSEYGFKLTGIEMFDKFRTTKDTVFFNTTLYKSIYPLVTHEARFDLEVNSFGLVQSNVDFLGIVDDFFDKPILYMNINSLNKLLNLPVDHISGFMINIVDQKDLVLIKNQIKSYFDKQNIAVEVVTWREINKKQNDILNIFTQIGILLKIIILVLSTIAVTVYLYKSILVKQPNLRLLNILGLRLISIVNSVISSVILSAVVCAVYITHIVANTNIPKILKEDFSIDIGFYIYDVTVAYIFLVGVVVLIINNMFKQKYNIFK